MSVRGRGFWLAAIAGMMFLGAGSAQAQGAAKLVAVPLPPMGWSSWNAFSNTVDSGVIEAQAKAMVATGMKKAGYQYVNIDEGWWLGQRDAEGNIVVDGKAWPALAAGEHDGDMRNIVRYIHGLGLKAGIYTDAGADGCGTFSPDLGPGYPHEGSEGHYEQDFLRFARWGFDYVKVDWCGGNKENLDPAVQYAEIARAINRAEAMTGHRLYFSLCEWGKNSPWTWAAGVGGVIADVWRTSGDIVAPIVANSKNSGRKASFKGMLKNFDQGVHPEAEHTGFYNDPDMMVIGMPGLTDAENRVHMSLWAMSGAPLLVGADLTTLSDATKAMLTNPAVLAVDQDAAEPATGLEVWQKRMAKPGARAVVLLNRTAAAATIEVKWGDIGLAGPEAAVTDVWTGKELGLVKEAYSAEVPAGDAVMVIVQGRDGKSTTFRPAGGSGAPVKKNLPVVFAKVAAGTKWAAVEIAYRNPDKGTRFAELRVNGQGATRVAFPATGGGLGAVWIEALLDGAGTGNVLAFSTDVDAGPEIESVTVQ